MCCVGQMCKQLGVGKRVLNDNCSIAGLIEKLTSNLKHSDDPLVRSNMKRRYRSVVSKVKAFIKTKNNRYMDEHRWIKAMYSVNDSRFTDDEVKEKKLKAIAKRAGHTLIFK